MFKIRNPIRIIVAVKETRFIMKKYLLSITILCLIISAWGCGNKEEQKVTSETSINQIEEIVSNTTEQNEVNVIEPSNDINESENQTTEVSEGDAEWVTEDFEMVKNEITNGDLFASWRSILSFMPSYDGENAGDLLISLMENTRYYNMFYYLKNYKITDCSFSEEDIYWYTSNILNVKETELDEFKENSQYYTNGIFNGTLAGAPGVECNISISDITVSDDIWTLRFTKAISYETVNSKSGETETVLEQLDGVYNAKMEVKEIEGKKCWTIYSLSCE